MSERPGDPYGDPITQTFWEAARERRFLIQRCADCRAHQFYPRPFCLACGGRVEWVESSGWGTVYTKTDVNVDVPPFTAPFTVAVVQLDEGPRIMTHLVGDPVPIGRRVRLDWRERSDGLPPLYVFRAEG